MQLLTRCYPNTRDIDENYARALQQKHKELLLQTTSSSAGLEVLQRHHFHESSFIFSTRRNARQGIVVKHSVTRCTSTTSTVVFLCTSAVIRYLEGTCKAFFLAEIVRKKVIQFVLYDSQHNKYMSKTKTVERTMV